MIRISNGEVPTQVSGGVDQSKVTSIPLSKKYNSWTYCANFTVLFFSVLMWVNMLNINEINNLL